MGSSLYPSSSFLSFIPHDRVPDIVPDRRPVASQSIRVCLTLSRIVAIVLEDIGKIKDTGRAFKEGRAGEKSEAMVLL